MKSSDSRNILITGAGGFLGRYLVKLLQNQGHTITGLGRTLHQDLVDQGVKWIQADIRNEDQIRKALENIAESKNPRATRARGDFYSEN